MGTEELENLVSQRIWLGLKGPELHAWVEGECAKVKAQGEAERAARKVAQARELADLTARLAELQRQ